MQEIAKESGRAAAIGLFSELGSQYMGCIVKEANKPSSIARKLINSYTETDGLFFQTFYEELFMALGEHLMESE